MKKIILLVIALLFIPLGMYAQNVTISGTIVDSTNEPAIGAAITVAGSLTGTTTGFGGHFSINAASSQYLVISCIGYKRKEVPVSSLRHGEDEDNVIVIEESDTPLDVGDEEAL